MKTNRILSLLLLCLTVFLLAGCANLHKTDIEEVITGELDLLKNLDSSTTQKYISYKELFPDAVESGSIPEEVEEVFSLFFQNFNYKILSLDVKENTAVADIRLQTIDAQTLAKDFAAARLEQYITTAADSPDTKDNTNDSLEAHYLLLYKILKEKEYGTVETSCTMHLVKKNEMWYIQSDPTLENQLVGGFISYLSDSRLLSAEEAAEIYFSTIKNLEEQQFANYLGLDSVLDTSDDTKKALAEALISKVHTLFNYQINGTSEANLYAEVDITLTTLDTQQVLDQYESKLNAYLATSDAVIDGVEGRTRYSQELLLQEIQNTSASATTDVSVILVNDGVSWKLKLNDSIGNALFGNLITLPSSSESSFDSAEDYAEDAEYEYDSEDTITADSEESEDDYCY